MIQQTAPAMQTLRSPAEVLREVRCGDVVQYRYRGQSLMGRVGGWRRLGFGNYSEHAVLIHRGENGDDRAVPIEDVTGKLIL